MISIKSLQYFASINSVFTLLTLFHYMFLYYSNFHFTMVVLSFVAKNTIILTGLQYILKDKPYIQEPQTRENHFSLSNFLVSSAMEATTFQLAIFRPETQILHNIILFIPESFFFELVFDFFHYTTHRLMHTVPFLYSRVHRKHHEESIIDEYTTFNHSLQDLLITNFFPMLATFYIIRVSHFTAIMLFWYKMTVEISGHSGKETTSSFIQCIYLPKSLGIDLYSRDHLLHHTKPSVNFSKRFSIWDKLFFTYKQNDRTM
jgi:sterol desaturase/sphingolipid hydroxylase (fatty acid hydroxylase superfamily)